jgi:uncharacterized repeat protein (TIGR01451 family)
VVTARHIVVLDDLNAGSYTNQATATGVDVNSMSQQAITNEVTVPAVQNPAIEIIKTADRNSYSSPNEVINYTLDVTNTGNVTLTDVIVTDNLTGFISPTVASLAPQATLQYTTSYTVVQSDVDFGLIVNQARVTSKDPKNVDVEDTGAETVRAIQDPEISITKTADKTTVSQDGEEIAYTIVVTNSGNVSLENVTVTDSNIPSFSPASFTLSPGETVTFTGPSLIYSVDLADLNAGVIDNTATVLAEVVGQVKRVNAIDQVTVNVVQTPDLEFTKRGDKFFFFQLGEVINYTLAVKNTGNVT